MNSAIIPFFYRATYKNHNSVYTEDVLYVSLNSSLPYFNSLFWKFIVTLAPSRQMDSTRWNYNMNRTYLLSRKIPRLVGMYNTWRARAQGEKSHFWFLWASGRYLFTTRIELFRVGEYWINLRVQGEKKNGIITLYIGRNKCVVLVVCVVANIRIAVVRERPVKSAISACRCAAGFRYVWIRIIYYVLFITEHRV